MKKTEAKQIAMDTMMEALGVAYYRISDGDDYSEEDKELIIAEMNKVGERVGKFLKQRFITY